MPGDFIDATRMLPASCKERTGEDVSKFVITGRDATPADDLQAAPPENSGVSDRESKSAKKGFLSPEIFEDKGIVGSHRSVKHKIRSAKIERSDFLHLKSGVQK